jgi:GTP cyclohydrolase II
MTMTPPAPPIRTEAVQELEETERAAVRVAIELDLVWRRGAPVPARIYTFDGLSDGAEHLAVEVLGSAPSRPAMVRLHSECLTGDVFGSARCDCGEQLAEAIEEMRGPGGYLIYLRQEGRGIGLYNKLDTYELQDRGRDTFEANRELGFPDDLRDYTPAAQMLAALGVPAVRLLSNNPTKRADLEAAGIAVDEVHPTGVHLTDANADYLAAKADQAGHTIDLDKEPVR